MTQGKMQEKVALATLGSTLYFILVNQVFADTVGTIDRPTLLPNVNAGQFISGLIGLMIIVAFIAAFIYLLWGGFQWLTSGGDEGALSSARGRIIQALIGLTVVVAAWAIFQLVQVAFGITILGGNLNDIFNSVLPRGS